MDPARARLLFVAVVLAVFVPVVVVLAMGGKDDDSPRGLKIEIGTDYLTVDVVDPALNVAKTTGGRSSVTLECRDRAGKLVSRTSERWPFLATDAGAAPPHVHVSAPRAEATATCRLLGTDPAVGGSRKL